MDKQIAIKHAKNYGLNTIPEMWRDNPEVVLSAIESNERDICHASYRLKNNKHFMLGISLMLKCYPCRELYDNPQFLVEVASHDVEIDIEHFGENAKKNYEAIKAWVKIYDDGASWEMISEEILSDIDKHIELHKTSKYGIYYVPEKLKDNKEFCKFVVGNSIYRATDMSEELWTSGFVKQCVLELTDVFKCYCEKSKKFISPAEKYSDNEIWINPKRMEAFHEDENNNPNRDDVLLDITFDNHGHVYRGGYDIIENHKDDKEIIMTLVMNWSYHYDQSIFSQLSPKLRGDKDVLSMFIDEYPDCYYEISDYIIIDYDVSNDLEFAKKAIKFGIHPYDLDKTTKNDEIIKLAIEYCDGFYIKYASDEIRHSKEWLTKAFNNIDSSTFWSSCLNDRKYFTNINYMAGLAISLPELFTDPDFFIDYLYQDVYILTDFDFLERVVEKNPEIMRKILGYNISDEDYFCDDDSDCEYPYGCSYHTCWFYGNCVHDECKTREYNIIKKSLSKDSSLLKSINNHYSYDEELNIIAVEKEGLILEYSKLNNNKNVVLAAVKNNGLAVIYASKELMNDIDILVAAVTAPYTGESFIYELIPDKFRYNFKVTYNAYSKYPKIFPEIPMEIRKHCTVNFKEYLRKQMGIRGGNNLGLYNNDYDLKILYSGK